MADGCPHHLEAAHDLDTTTFKYMSPMKTSTTCTKNSESTEVPKGDKNTCGHFGRIEPEMDEMFNVTEKAVRPSLAKRLARAAVLTTALMAPVRELVGMVQPQLIPVAHHENCPQSRVSPDPGVHRQWLQWDAGELPQWLRPGQQEGHGSAD